jgi:hypothetical protein
VSSGWNIEDRLSSMFWLFNYAPARVADFQQVTESAVMPLKFCKHRWLENVNVMQRAIQIYPMLKKYVKAVKGGKLPDPKTKSYESVCEAVCDPLFVAKGEVFISIATEVEPFLATYQTDAPMLPFLVCDLFTLARNLLERFVKDDVMSNVKNAEKMVGLNLDNKANLKDASKVNVGFVAKQLITDLKNGKAGPLKISDRDVLTFKMECRNFLMSLVKKLLEKSPLQYALARNVLWLNPSCIITQTSKCKPALEKCLQHLVNAGQVDQSKCDIILREYQILLDTIAEQPGSTPFASFDKSRNRIDNLYHSFLANSPQYTNLWPIVKLILSLSHGQASVERGFSINKELVVENQKESSLIARRLVTDHIREVGGVRNVAINKTMLQFAANARHRYRNCLEMAASKQRNEEQTKKRKQAEQDIDSLKAKKRCLEKDIQALRKEADVSSEKAEKQCDLTWTAKANALRRSATDKELKLQKLQVQLEEKRKI